MKCISDHLLRITFKLLVIVMIGGVANSYAATSMSVSPNPCVFSAGSAACQFTINWQTDEPSASLWGNRGGFYSRLAASPGSVSGVISDASEVVTYEVHVGQTRGTLLASATLTGASGQLTATSCSGAGGCAVTVNWSSSGTPVSLWQVDTSGERLISQSAGGSISIFLTVPLTTFYLHAGSSRSGVVVGAANSQVSNVDSDSDGIVDSEDAFPNDATESVDTDGDGIGDNADNDDDGDLTLDENDAFPLNPDEDTDTDGDGVGNNRDRDDDDDGIDDIDDAFPLDETEFDDTDGDGIGSNVDDDDDGDGVVDGLDAFPLDPNETEDLDGDGIGDNQDSDLETSGLVYLMTSSMSGNVTTLHVINDSSVEQRFTGTLFNSDGAQLGRSNEALHIGGIDPKGRLKLTSRDLENIFSVGPWQGPAILEVKGFARFNLMTVLRSPSGLTSNTNCVRTDNVQYVGGFDSRSVSYIRLINIGDTPLENLRGSLFDEEGQLVGNGEVVVANRLNPKQAMWLTRNDLSGLVGEDWMGTATLSVSNLTSLRLLNLEFVNSSTFFNFSCYETGS